MKLMSLTIWGEVNGEMMTWLDHIISAEMVIW